MSDFTSLKRQCDKGWSLGNMAEYWQRDKRTIGRWLKKHGLQTQKIRRYLYGENHPNYKHGKSNWKRKTDPKKHSVINI